MRRLWLTGVIAMFGCFDPTDQHGNSSGAESSSGNDPSTTTQGVTTTTSMTASSTDSPTTTATSDPTTTASTTDDPTDATTTGVDESSSGAASSSESTGDATESSTGTSPGAGYGPCGTCADDEIEATIQDVMGCYCAPPCPDMTCPAGPDGTAMAQCAVGGEMGMMYCALLCDPLMMGECPMAMACVEITSMPGVGICTYP
ncbi:MAG TPA: hypothetical protein VG755_32225 [Nannocystaceae bacterium]|nr:hypothetical protein [Nannocystaceae bacterium]